MNPVTNQYGYYFDRMNELTMLLQNDNLFLIDPCMLFMKFRQLGNYQAPPVVTNRIAQLNQQWNSYTWVQMNSAQNPLVIQDINNASGAAINCDYFPVHISLLPIVNGVPFSAADLFDYFRKNINSFIDNSIATFEPYKDPIMIDDQVLWNSPNPVTALLHLNMANDGTVIVTDYKLEPDDSYFRVATIRSPIDGLHPVSGNREWGIKYDAQHGGYTFYTTAVDRITTSLFDMGNSLMDLIPGVNSGFENADLLWTSLQNKMVDFINSHGGHAEKYTLTPSVGFRPPWKLVSQYLTKEISLQVLKAALGCP